MTTWQSLAAKEIYRMARRGGAKTTGYFGMTPTRLPARWAKRTTRGGACANEAGILRGLALRTC
ncbi:hypothetical protein, partial [Burkholderia stabilis]